MGSQRNVNPVHSGQIWTRMRSKATGSFVTSEKGTSKRRIRWKRWVFGLPIAVAIPFILLVRLSTWLYVVKQMNGWGALILSALAGALILGAIVWVVGRKFGARPGLKVVRYTALLLGFYCVYLLVFVSMSNVKTEDLQATYRHLHPVLRVALSTFILLDGDVVVTDTERVPEDYRAMGLSSRSTSFHFEQEDGYVHAVDLRTRDRTRLQNTVTKVYFDLMGFSTLRHSGTADHLHVSLPMRY